MSDTSTDVILVFVGLYGTLILRVDYILVSMTIEFAYIITEI